MMKLANVLVACAQANDMSKVFEFVDIMNRLHEIDKGNFESVSNTIKYGDTDLTEDIKTASSSLKSSAFKQYGTSLGQAMLKIYDTAEKHRLMDLNTIKRIETEFEKNLTANMAEVISGMLYGIVEDENVKISRNEMQKCLTNVDAAYRDLKKGIEFLDEQTISSTLKGIRDLMDVLKDVIHQLRECG